MAGRAGVTPLMRQLLVFFVVADVDLVLLVTLTACLLWRS